jgi:hypothetical protein
MNIKPNQSKKSGIIYLYHKQKDKRIKIGLKNRNVSNEISILSEILEVDGNLLAKLYHRYSADISRVVRFINNEVDFNSLWTEVEDEILKSGGGKYFNDLMQLKGSEEVRKRKLYLNIK